MFLPNGLNCKSKNNSSDSVPLNPIGFCIKTCTLIKLYVSNKLHFNNWSYIQPQIMVNFNFQYVFMQIGHFFIKNNEITTLWSSLNYLFFMQQMQFDAPNRRYVFKNCCGDTPGSQFSAGIQRIASQSGPLPSKFLAALLSGRQISVESSISVIFIFRIANIWDFNIFHFYKTILMNYNHNFLMNFQ